MKGIPKFRNLLARPIFHFHVWEEGYLEQDFFHIFFRLCSSLVHDVGPGFGRFVAACLAERRRSDQRKRLPMHGLILLGSAMTPKDLVDFGNRKKILSIVNMTWFQDMVSLQNHFKKQV